MKKEFAVYNPEKALDAYGLTYENDLMDWFEDEEEAEKAAKEMAQENPGEEIYLQEVKNGDFGEYTVIVYDEEAEEWTFTEGE